MLLDPDSVAQSNFLKRHEIVAFQALPLKIDTLFFPRPIQDHLGHASDLMLTLSGAKVETFSPLLWTLATLPPADRLSVVFGASYMPAA